VSTGDVAGIAEFVFGEVQAKIQERERLFEAP
jgi:hypothetical protein